MSIEENILLKLAKIADEYSNSTGNNVLLVAMETSSNGEPMGMTLQKNSNPIVTIGVIDALMGLLKDEKAKSLKYLQNGGEKHVAKSSSELNKKLKGETLSGINSADDAIAALELINEFKALKDEGDRIKETDPVRLIEIMNRMGELSSILRDLENDVKTKRDNKDSQDPLDKFKDTF